LCKCGSNLVLHPIVLAQAVVSVLRLQEVALLAQPRAPGLPPIRIVSEMPMSDRWAAVAVDLPFEAVNEVLGVQLERSIIRGVPP
jgi:hypothetical protein